MHRQEQVQTFVCIFCLSPDSPPSEHGVDCAVIKSKALLFAWPTSWYAQLLAKFKPLFVFPDFHHDMSWMWSAECSHWDCSCYGHRSLPGLSKTLHFGQKQELWERNIQDVNIGISNAQTVSDLHAHNKNDLQALWVWAHSLVAKNWAHLSLLS